MWTNVVKVISGVLVGLTLTGCTQTREALGLNRNKLDEWSVNSRAPLSMPPDLKNLPEPQPGTPRPQEKPPQEQAKEAILPPSAQKRGDRTEGEKIVLAQAGTEKRDPNIRKIVNDEARADLKKEASFIRRVMPLGKGKKPGKVINPEEEQKRLSQTASSQPTSSQK